MSTLEAGHAPLDAFESAIMSAALTIVMQKAIKHGLSGCDAERNAIASFANFAASKAISMHRAVECPDHRVETVVVRGLVFALARSILEIASHGDERQEEGERLLADAVTQLREIITATLGERQPTHEVAGGVQ